MLGTLASQSSPRRQDFVYMSSGGRVLKDLLQACKVFTIQKQVLIVSRPNIIYLELHYSKFRTRLASTRK